MTLSKEQQERFESAFPEEKERPTELLKQYGIRTMPEDNVWWLVASREKLKQFIASEISLAEKAFGGCEICYGKGYATVRYGEQGYDDFGGEGYVSPVRTNMHFCKCERGKQLSALLTPPTKTNE